MDETNPFTKSDLIAICKEGADGSRLMISQPGNFWDE